MININKIEKKEKTISIPDRLKHGPYEEKINVNGIELEWDIKKGQCTFQGIPVAMLWVDSTLAGLMTGMATMVGPERFNLSLQSEGRKSVESDWLLISGFEDFHEGFSAFKVTAAVAGWGDWQVISYDLKRQHCIFRAYNNWEGMYQTSIGVCWGSGMLAGKFSGICSKLFQKNCWATQTSFVAKGDPFDEFEVYPSSRHLEHEIEKLLDSDEATRADMAVVIKRLKETEISLRQEINDRIQAEHSLLIEAEKNIALLRNASDGIHILDSDGNIIDAGDSFSAMLGYRHDEIIGMNVTQWDVSFTEAECLSIVRDQLTKQANRLIETSHRRKDGAIIDVEINISSLELGGKKVLFCSSRDITERKRADDKERLHLEKLAHVTRLGLMGEMASGIAHEVNQPLCAITTYTQVIINLLNIENPDLIKIKEILSKTQQQALRAGQIIHRMKEFGKSHSNHHLNTDINRLIYDASDFCITELKYNNVKLNFELINDLCPVFVDHIQIEQVIINLIKNSVEALQDLPQNIQRQITIRSHFAANNDIQVSVKDNGLGIDEIQRYKILTPFYTTKINGTGMGLSISRSLIESYGGTLYFNSELGKGSTFYFTLPIETANRS
ncbi:ATP-binding protein [Methylobacter psychrophilus]|uniref:ATP-binding protein n=1 Tax=Methylobacter psychrophilus TaxID=96941 RepID=UPI0021D515C8|nr:ATP-binding protein [Methylobacter psychrophilus]